MRASCIECGERPTNHWFEWASTSFEMLLKHAPRFNIGARAMSGKVLPYKIAKALKVITLQDDMERVSNTRSRAMWEEARARGIAVRQLCIFGSPVDFYEATVRGKAHVFQSLPTIAWLSSESLWPDDKYLLKQKFIEEGVATPAVQSVSTLHEAKEALHRLGVVCVKPRTGSNARHTFPHVSTEAELEEAFYSAKKLCHFVVVEENLEGNLARATCVGGKLIGFLECAYPSVVGDGHSTISELIEKINKERPLHAKDIEVTKVHEHYIARRGYALKDILEEGKDLPLIYRAGYNSGGRNWEHGTRINTALMAEIERAARITELPVVGFDLIIESPHKGPGEQRWGIIEANSMPWIELHSHPRYEEPSNVAAAIWDLWEKALR